MERQSTLYLKGNEIFRYSTTYFYSISNNVYFAKKDILKLYLCKNYTGSVFLQTRYTNNGIFLKFLKKKFF